MAIDFSQVKTITIPEGSVTKITDSNGNTLWQSASWHTLWKGSVTSNNDTSRIKVANLNALSGTVTLRVTWSSTASGGYDMTTKYYNNNGWQNTTTIKPHNPFQFDLDTAFDREYIVGCARFANNRGRDCYLEWDHIYKTFNLSGGVKDSDGGVNLSMTVTKIEQYY